MILYQNSLMVLDYSPATDILTVDWPNAPLYLLPEIKYALQMLVENVKNYDIKFLLIDAGKTITNHELMDSPEYKEMVTQFSLDLNTTRLKKSARIISLDNSREEKTQELTRNLTQTIQFNYQFQSFTSREEAINWLMLNNI
ncbi:hypothetical protein [Adhaeribacter aquaticus]|uniref:hypothetical protein n=1 Tax=Adhaeribacter aquaticus TaxID=299567 RepID=UPI00047BFF8A|nr:hypothetical protein [Adhaeribacter aquaticus]